MNQKTTAGRPSLSHLRSLALRAIELGRPIQEHYDAEQTGVAKHISFYLTEPEPVSMAALKDWISGVSSEDLSWLAALVYCGREDDDDLDGMHAHLRSGWGPSYRGPAEGVFRKVPMPDYLLHALALLMPSAGPCVCKFHAQCAGRGVLECLAFWCVCGACRGHGMRKCAGCEDCANGDERAPN
jgi:hypothetical protein